MKRSNSNPNRPLRRRSFRGWLKRVTLSNNHPKKIEPEEMRGGVFGVPLTESIQYAKTNIGYVDDDGLKHSKAGSIPIVVAKCGSFLKKNGLQTEGIFRISGSVKRINMLEFQFDQSTNHYGLGFNWEGYTVHDAANLLTRYLNKLPNSVIPFEHYQDFHDVMNHHDEQDRIDAFQRLIQTLPPAHQHLLLYLLDTLSLFTSHVSQTKMSTSNLAAVFCPGLLRHPDHNTPSDYKVSQHVIECLIESQSLLTIQLLDKLKMQPASDQESIRSLPTLPLRVVNGSVHSSERSNEDWVHSPDDMTPVDRSATKQSTVLHRLHQVLKSWMDVKSPRLFVCAPIALLLVGVTSYETYLALSLQSLMEPLFFFFGLFSYYNLLLSGIIQQGGYSDIWRVGSWNTSSVSIASQSSRFSEESGTEDEEEDNFGFDPATLEMYLAQYNQIKKDAELAKQLQQEEQKAVDVNNPFVNEKEAWKIKTFS
ncbi:hypothetical protein G6F43_007430 [Rhizopus delemar]|nr:hypothetical protein G6F43_007430 [Rhizopus delemar]